MSVETSVPQQATAFSHPRLADLIKRAQAAPGVGPVIIQTLGDLVHAQDSVLMCFYSLDAGAGGVAPDANNYYACEVVLVTSAYYINIGLFPKSHMYRKRKIATISDCQVKYDPPSPEELRGLQPGKFAPNNIALTVVFADERGNPVDTWSIESSAPDQVRNLTDIARFASKCVGYPLAKIGQPAAAPSAGQASA